MTSRSDENVARGTRAGPRRLGPEGGSSWGLPVALVLLSLLPVIAGVLRIVEIFGGPRLLPDNPRVGASPVPVVFHVVAAAGYALVGAFQFSAGFRRRHPGWARRAGRVLVGAGLVVAGSGRWLTLVRVIPVVTSGHLTAVERDEHGEPRGALHPVGPHSPGSFRRMPATPRGVQAGRAMASA